MSITAIKTVTVPVADQDRALAFYRDALGFEVRADNPFGDMRWITVAPAGAVTEFVLHTPFAGEEPGWLTGVVLATDDIEAVVSALRTAGTDVTDPEFVGWGTQATFSDPDGNGFVLLQQ